MSMTKPNFDPGMWGPASWLMIHLAALRYPDDPTPEDKKRFYTFFRNLQYILPCDGCCKGFHAILESTRFGAKDLRDRDALFAWTVAAHDMVNAKTGKATGVPWKLWKQRYLQLAAE